MRDERARRLAENESLFREVNERVRELAARHGADAHLYEFLCECSNVDCTLRLELTVGEYERARSTGAWFLVAPGHELPEIERVVETTERYSLVEKLGEGREEAERRDPRG